MPEVVSLKLLEARDSRIIRHLKTFVGVKMRLTVPLTRLEMTPSPQNSSGQAWFRQRVEEVVFTTNDSDSDSYSRWEELTDSDDSDEDSESGLDN